MCGIWASVGFQPAKAVLDVVAHRGPDGQGWREFISEAGPVTLGHRRLAVIDVSDNGLQPMQYGDGRYWLTFNGEIYNYLELRVELAAKGYRFASCTDSEVLLAAYSEWGEECLNRFNGMFAFIIWDDRDKVLFAARDRFGVKPLYVCQIRGGIAFASEIKQFVMIEEFSARLNQQRAYDFLSTGIFDHTNETLFSGVVQLRGGESLRIATAGYALGGLLPVRRWYQLPRPGSIRCGEAEAAERYRTLLEDSVRLRLRSDVPVGSCLSGGLDSSSIVCLMNEILREHGGAKLQKTFSALYAGTSVDESRFVDAVVDRTMVESFRTTPAPENLFSLLERMAWHQDEPFGSTSIYAQWEVFKLAKHNGVTVMLDGQGADEQLGGYHYMYGTYHAGLLRSLRFIRLLRELEGQRRVLGTSLYAQVRALAVGTAPEALLNVVQTLRNGSLRPAWLSGPGWDGCDAYRSPVPDALRRNGLPAVNGLGDLCLAQVASINLPMLLHYEDRNSMAHSVEARVPFLDYRLVELALALGDEHKIVNGESKRVQRCAMADLLPRLVVERRDKLGFPTPEASWLRGPIGDAVRTAVDATAVRFPDLFDIRKLRGLVDDMVDGRTAFDAVPWRVVSFGVWAERFGVSS